MYSVLKYFYKKEEYLIPGDLNIWYLGCNEKFGVIQYKGKEWKWNFGESSFDRVREAIMYMHQDLFITTKQFIKLMKACNEGELIDDAYSIGDYLETKSSWWRSWKKPNEWRSSSKEYFNIVKKDLEKENFKITSFGNEVKE